MSTQNPVAAHHLRPSRSHVLVVGGGTMGSDVAVVLLRAGCKTTVFESQAARLPAIPAQVSHGLQQLQASCDLGRLHVASGDDAVDWPSVDLVIECIPEQLPLKQALFHDLVGKARPDTLLASNSSSFPISAIAQGLPTQERMLGLHFFMPAHLTPLVEVVNSDATDPDCAANLHAFMRQCGMVPVMVRKDLPGFLANRLQHALAREAFALIDAGVATAEDVDAAVRFGFGFRFLAAGPALQRDHAGLEVHCAAAASMYPSLAVNASPAACLSERVAAGQYGIKTGQGFYSWNEQTARHERARYQQALLAGLAILKDELPPVGDAPLPTPPTT